MISADGDKHGRESFSADPGGTMSSRVRHLVEPIGDDVEAQPDVA
jgi:hypothetical protein